LTQIPHKQKHLMLPNPGCNKHNTIRPCWAEISRGMRSSPLRVDNRTGLQQDATKSGSTWAWQEQESNGREARWLRRGQLYHSFNQNRHNSGHRPGVISIPTKSRLVNLIEHHSRDKVGRVREGLQLSPVRRPSTGPI